MTAIGYSSKRKEYPSIKYQTIWASNWSIMGVEGNSCIPKKLTRSLIPAYLVRAQMTLESIPLGFPFKGSAVACQDKHFMSILTMSASLKTGSEMETESKTSPKRTLSKNNLLIKSFSSVAQ